MADESLYDPALWRKLMLNAMPEPNSGCLLWLACCYKTGYGAVRWSSRTQQAHRMAWQATRGPIPDGGHVLHKCDVRCCINPAHLFLGTNQDNVADMVAKKRHLWGSSQNGAKLTEEKAMAIYLMPLCHTDIARAFGVSQPTVSMIKAKRTWRHIHVDAIAA